MPLIYFDHNATTAVDEKVLEAMIPFFRQKYGNASSLHSLGIEARRAINQAREQVACAVGVQPAQIIFTSGGSEANNLFIRGAADYLKVSSIVISAIEHPCVTRPAQELARRSHNPWSLHQLIVNTEGQVNLDDASIAIANKPGLVSVMLANNETGVIQEVAAIAELAKTQGAWMHTDAVQAFGKISLNFSDLNVHAMTISSHKIYGPKGAAALIVDKRLILKPLIYGGGHENGIRSGTENVPAIVGFGVACELIKTRIAEMSSHITQLREYLEQGLIALGATIFGQNTPRLPNTCYFAIPDIEGDTRVVKLDKAGFAVASGAACSSATPGKSHVLEAMGVSPMLARCAVRISLGHDNSMDQIDDFLRALDKIVSALRQFNSMRA